MAVALLAFASYTWGVAIVLRAAPRPVAASGEPGRQTVLGWVQRGVAARESRVAPLGSSREPQSWRNLCRVVAVAFFAVGPTSVVATSVVAITLLKPELPVTLATLMQRPASRGTVLGGASFFIMVHQCSSRENIFSSVW